MKQNSRAGKGGGDDNIRFFAINVINANNVRRENEEDLIDTRVFSRFPAKYILKNRFKTKIS